MLKNIMKIISILSLGLLTVPSLFFLSGSMELDRVKALMLLATLIWFVTAGSYMWGSDRAS